MSVVSDELERAGEITAFKCRADRSISLRAGSCRGIVGVQGVLAACTSVRNGPFVGCWLTLSPPICRFGGGAFWNLLSLQFGTSSRLSVHSVQLAAVPRSNSTWDTLHSLILQRMHELPDHDNTALVSRTVAF